MLLINQFLVIHFILIELYSGQYKSGMGFQISSGVGNGDGRSTQSWVWDGEKKCLNIMGRGQKRGDTSVAIPSWIKVSLV